MSRALPEFDAEGRLVLEIGGDRLAFVVDVGLRVASWPLAHGEGGILVLRPGATDDPRYEPSAIVVRLSPQGLAYLLGDLNALFFEILGEPRPPAPPDREPLAEDVVRVLTAAGHALRSYASGNAAPQLAADTAELVDQTLARFGRPRTDRGSDVVDIRMVL